MVIRRDTPRCYTAKALEFIEFVILPSRQARQETNRHDIFDLAQAAKHAKKAIDMTLELHHHLATNDEV